jgi:hypothetical protein
VKVFYLTCRIFLISESINSTVDELRSLTVTNELCVSSIVRSPAFSDIPHCLTMWVAKDVACCEPKHTTIESTE